MKFSFLLVLAFSAQVFAADRPASAEESKSFCTAAPQIYYYLGTLTNIKAKDCVPAPKVVRELEDGSKIVSGSFRDNTFYCEVHMQGNVADIYHEQSTCR